MTASRTVVLATAWLAFASVAGAQDLGSTAPAALVADRPGFADSTGIVGRGVVQFEAGFFYGRDGDGADQVGVLAVPNTLIRFGVGQRLELRLLTDGVVSSRADGARSTGFADLEVGAKVQVLQQDAAGIDLVIIPSISLPTGSSDVTAGANNATVKFTWARSLGAGVGLNGTYNVTSVPDDDGRFIRQAVSAALGHDVGGGWTGFAEVYGLLPVERSSGAGWSWDAGVSRLIGANLQIDAEGGRALNADAPDWFVSFGVVIRGHAKSTR